MKNEEVKKSSAKWFPYDKGGEFRKWYGNQDCIVNWSNNGFELQTTMHPDGKRIWAHNFNLDKIFYPHVGWSDICSNGLSFRFFSKGFHFDGSANALFASEQYIYHILAFANSIITKSQKNLLNPTIHFKPGNFLNLPYIDIDSDKTTKCCISISKQDWDSHETSWDFEENPLLSYINKEIAEGETGKSYKIESLYNLYTTDWEERFMQLQANEEELNRQFIEIYGLQDELTPDVPLDEVTILQQGEIKVGDNHIEFQPDVVVKQFISYAVGCMMGRYRLDKPGLHIAHPNPTDDEVCTYSYNGSNFTIDDDAIIPLMARDTVFTDNVGERFREFLKVALGEETLTENLNFIEGALGKDIDTYFVKDFWKDHLSRYQRRPIYWLFASKKGAFQCITYMHRMNPYTAEQIRNKYLLPHIEYLGTRIAEMESRAATLSTKERKDMAKLQKDLKECREYHDRLHLIADKQIDFDLDDGVVVNYAKFEDVVVKLK